MHLRIAFIGAGQVNFGGAEGPWDHASRIERLHCERKQYETLRDAAISVVGIADPDIERCMKVLELRRNPRKEPNAFENGLNATEIWKDTKCYSNPLVMLDELCPTLVFIGIPPEKHGSSKAPNNLVLECTKRRIHMFVEKPISCHPVDDVELVAREVNQACEEGLVVSVGYMFRYSKAVLRMKELIEQFGAVRAFSARYMCAYTNLAKPMWWDAKTSGGPVIEQATHFCDLARFLCGEVDFDSIKATSVKQHHQRGHLNHFPSSINEHAIPISRRIPRVTTAFWKFADGSVGTLTHGVLLHKEKYETEIEVWGDGYRIQLEDPYHKCRLKIRAPLSEDTTIEDHSGDDSYLEEDRIFLEAILDRTRTCHIQSPYHDAVNTYKLTWMIAQQSMVEST